MSKGVFDIVSMCLLGLALNVVLLGILKAMGILCRVYLHTALVRKLVPLFITIGSLFITATFAPKLMPFPITVLTMLGLATVYGFHLAAEDAADDRVRAPAPVPAPQTVNVVLPTPQAPTRTVSVELPTGHMVTLPLDGMTEYEIRLAGANPVRIDREGKPLLPPTPPKQEPEVPRKSAWQHINEEDDE